MARNLTPPTGNANNSRTLCFLKKCANKSENSPNYAIGRITQKLSFGRIPKNSPAAQNRLIGGRRASRRADMEQFSKVISQAKLLCTRIRFFENFYFGIQIKNCDNLEISSETAKVISFSATFFKILRFSEILSWTASWFLKIRFGIIIFTIHATTFSRLNYVFLDHLGHELPLVSFLKILKKINSPAKLLCTRLENYTIIVDF